MLNIIDKIVEIDKQAAREIEEARAEAARITLEAEKKLSQLESDFAERAEKRLDIVRAEYNRFADDEIAESAAKFSAETARLTAVAGENGLKWQAEILSGVLGGYANAG